MKRQSRDIQSFRESKLSVVNPIILSYCVFLLICMTLVLFICLTTSRSRKESFWKEKSAHFDTVLTKFDDMVDSMNIYANQLLTDSTFIRLANTDSTDSKQFLSTANQVMSHLSSRSFGLMSLPIRESFIYLQNSEYIISASQFTDLESYYRSYRSFDMSSYADFLKLLQTADCFGEFIDTSRFTKSQNSISYIRRVNRIANRETPAVVVFEMNTAVLENMFLLNEVDSGAVYLYNSKGELQLQLGSSAIEPPASDSVGSADYNKNGIRYICQSYGDTWIAVFAFPASMYRNAVGNLDLLAIVFFLISLGVGVLISTLFIVNTLRPFYRLSTQLTEAKASNAVLEKQIDDQKPALMSTYVRTLLSGHVSSHDEFSYLMEELGLAEGGVFYVLYCIAHQQSEYSALQQENRVHNLLTEYIESFLSTQYPVHHYIKLGGEVVVLVTYNDDIEDHMEDLQHRLSALHDALLLQHSIWLCAGVGNPATHPQQLWESFEQARSAARFTAKNHVFLPYSFIKKDTETWYYPIEISAKLLHFITSANQEQVSEMFSLVYRENVTERNLSVPLMNLLLSDLKNTLLKARYQIPKHQIDQRGDELTQLDQRLLDATTFAQLEINALALCSFFVRIVEPSDPIPEIEQYLQENFTDPSLCLSKLSEKYHISQSYLSHLFKEKIGLNFSVYLENLRMTEALNRIQCIDCNISSLYAELGYTTPTTFRRAFKKHYGKTPSEMKQIYLS